MVFLPLLHILYYMKDLYFFCSLMTNPLVEKEELFVRGVGDGSDIVSKVSVFESIHNIGNVHIRG